MTVPILAGFSDTSAFSAYSVLKLKDMVISLKNSTASLWFYRIEIEDADAIVRIGATHSHTHEPLRVAHLIATGIVCRESKRQA